MYIRYKCVNKRDLLDSRGILGFREILMIYIGYKRYIGEIRWI